MRAAAIVLLVLSSAIGAGCGPAYVHLAEAQLDAGADALACDGYVVWNHENVNHVILVLGGTGNGSMAFVHPSLEGLLDLRAAAYATLDKPGLHSAFGRPGAVRWDDRARALDTQGHHLACAEEALLWVVRQFGPATEIHLRGHSEGALISLYLYERLLAERSPLADRISSLVLSGVPIEPFADIMARQLDTVTAHDGGALRDAVAACDWSTMRDRLGFSCRYLEDAVTRPSGFDMFQRLTALAPRAPIYFFQGTHDFNTPVEFAQELERWVEANPGLNFTMRYFDGGHGGTDDVRREGRELLLSLTSASR